LGCAAQLWSGRGHWPVHGDHTTAPEWITHAGRQWIYRQGRKCALGQSGDPIDLARRHLHHERHPVAELPAMVLGDAQLGAGMGSFSAGDDVPAGRLQRLQRVPLAFPRTNLSTRQRN